MANRTKKAQQAAAPILEKLLLGTPGSREVVVLFEDQTRLSMYGLSGGLNGKRIEDFLAALRRATATV